MSRSHLRAKCGFTRAAAILLLALFTPAVPVAAETTGPTVHLTVAPYVDIPLPPDSNLFGLGGGIEASALWELPFCRPLSAGVTGGYRFAPIKRADLGDLGPLNLLSAATCLQLQATIAGLVDLGTAASFGYFYAFETGDSSSWATNLMLGGELHVGYRVNSRLTAGITVTYRNYMRIYHLLDAGVYLTVGL